MLSTQKKAIEFKATDPYFSKVCKKNYKAKKWCKSVGADKSDSWAVGTNILLCK